MSHSVPHPKDQKCDRHKRISFSEVQQTQNLQQVRTHYPVTRYHSNHCPDTLILRLRKNVTGSGSGSPDSWWVRLHHYPHLQHQYVAAKVFPVGECPAWPRATPVKSIVVSVIQCLIQTLILNWQDFNLTQGQLAIMNNISLGIWYFSVMSIFVAIL